MPVFPLPVAACARACRLLALLASLLSAACGAPEAPPPPPAAASAPADSEHAGLTEPHGDHTPHHGGLVLMNGDVHYEVVLGPDGRYALWFSDAIREDLPASVATNVQLTVSRPGAADERIALALDDSGESWVGTGQPVAPDANALVKLNYDLRGTPHEVEIPFVPAKP
jgi:hypothetical protein